MNAVEDSFVGHRRLVPYDNGGLSDQLATAVFGFDGR